MYSPQQFSTLPPPSSISNLTAGYNQSNQQQQQQQPFVHPTPAPFNPFQSSAVAPAAAPAAAYDSSALSHPPPLQQPAAPIQYPQMQTYSSFPQVQSGGGGGGGAVTTPISLPGMPPITVSTTIPPQQLEGIQFNPAVVQQHQPHQ